MKLTDILESQDLEQSIIIGNYGNGNYGDELLLEVLAGMLRQRGVQQVTLTCLKPELYDTYHHDFGYPRVTIHDRRRLLAAILKSKTVVIGGGGLWGMDVNPNIFLLSLLLYISRRVLDKKVYLLGVGYYDSTSRLGHISAWLAGKAANAIVARDDETLRNFHCVNHQVALDTDIAWHIPNLDLKPYKNDLGALEQQISLSQKTMFITLRRFRATYHNNYLQAVEAFLAGNQGRPVILALMEPRSVDPENYQRILSWQQQYKNIQAIDFAYNPLTLYLFFQRHRHQLALIGPQFHILITAHLTKVPFLPLAYDNKVVELFKQIGEPGLIAMQAVQPDDLQRFADVFYQGSA